LLFLSHVAGIPLTGACNKKQVDTALPTSAAVTAGVASPGESYAMVTMADGSRYGGQLILKSGSQMTFRGVEEP
jgi:hypothetical protein